MKVMFDNFESVKMARFYDPTTDGFFDEPIIDEESQDFADDEAEAQFWVVQGHKPNGGVETITEFGNKPQADEMTDFFNSLLEKAGIKKG